MHIYLYVYIYMYAYLVHIYTHTHTKLATHFSDSVTCPPARLLINCFAVQLIQFFCRSDFV